MKASNLQQVLLQDKPLVIAIDGPSGSGKSTLSAILEEQYDCMVFHTDDYFLQPAQRTEERLREPGGNVDYERMELEIFQHLHDQSITSNHFNCTTNQLEHREPQLLKQRVVIEGVYSLHPRFLKYYDVTVFLNIDRQTQLDRIFKRSNEVMLQRFINEWIPLEDLYFSTFNIQKTAQFILDSTLNFREIL